MVLDKDFRKNIVYIDIETASKAASFDDLEQHEQVLWDKKSKNLLKDSQKSPHEKYPLQAGIFAEFSKVICISIGIFKPKKKQFSENSQQAGNSSQADVYQNSNHQPEEPYSLEEHSDSGQKNETRELFFYCKSFYGHDEQSLLQKFCTFLADYKVNPLRFCAHNGKEFDYPFLARRILANNLALPKPLLEIQGKKPWENKHLDTMQLWKFGDYKNFTSLELLAHVLGVTSPKQEKSLWGDQEVELVDGSMIHSLYHEKKDLKKIVDYCERDVFCTAQIFFKMNSWPPINPKNFISLTL